MADNFLTRKIGPLPAWGWAGVGAGIFVIYRWRKNSAASSTTAATGTTTGTAGSGYGDYSSGTGDQASLSTPSGFSYSGPASYLTNPSLSSLFGGSSTSPTPAVAATSGAYTSLLGENYISSGYGAPGATSANPLGSIGTPITTSSGTFAYAGPSQNAAAQAAGQTPEVQILPGDFVPYTPSMAGAPIFYKTG